MKEISAIVMLTIAVLCACAMAESMSVNQTGISGNISERNPFQDAVQGYDQALQLDHGNASAWLGKAQVSKIQGNQIESREYFLKALDATNGTLKDDSQDAKAWQAMGVALAGLARNEEAIGALERSIEISEQRLEENPEDADSWWLKAVSYEALYMDYAAIKAYEKVIELNSTKSVGAWIRIADILFAKANGYNESVEAFNEAIRLMPDNASWAGGVVLDQGNSILRTDVWQDDDKILRVTISSYNKYTKKFDFIQQIASRLASTWLFRDNSIGFLKTSAEFAALAANRMQEKTEGWYKKSQELFQNASYEESVEALNRAIELDPQNATLWDAKASSLGIAASFDGNRSQYNESLKAQDKAIELDPGNSTLHIHKGFFIARLAELSGHKNESLYEEAIKEFDEAVELDPKNEEAWIWKGSVLDAYLNRSAEALLAYNRAIELEGANAGDNQSLSNAWSSKGTALAKLGRYNESFEAFDKAIELNPQIAAYVWLAKGDALNQSGRYEEAAFAYDKVVEQNPDSSQALTAQAFGSKGDALLAGGRYDEAVKAYDEAIEQYPLEPMGAQTWNRKGIALQALGRTSEADAAFAKAKELGYQA
ncbi:MAG: tetratricopeptide repeat protein [Methanothrix sp.]|uniref:tetratricopeptide repeat protein n=1 Tax=Methanothrix sp. TaxID=90426 RepID=UPI003BB51540